MVRTCRRPCVAACARHKLTSADWRASVGTLPSSCEIDATLPTAPHLRRRSYCSSPTVAAACALQRPSAGRQHVYGERAGVGGGRGSRAGLQDTPTPPARATGPPVSVAEAHRRRFEEINIQSRLSGAAPSSGHGGGADDAQWNIGRPKAVRIARP